jgi:PAS domain S-box-containing protein
LYLNEDTAADRTELLRQIPRLIAEAQPCTRVELHDSARPPDVYLERLSGMTRKAPLAILELDAKGRIIHANPAAILLSRRLGIRMSNFHDALPPNIEELVKDCLFRTTMSSMPDIEVEVGGHTIVWDMQAVRNQGVVYAFGMDITIRLRAQTELARSEENLRELVNSISDIIIRISRTGIIEFISPQWSRLLGHPAEAAIATPLAQWIEREDIALVETALSELLAGKKSIAPAPFRVRHADGSIRYLSATGTLSSRQDQNFITLLVRDVTMMQHLEQQLRQSQKMEAVGLLAGGVAHDFNNLLTGINGYLELAVMELPAEHHIISDLVQAQNCATRAAELTRQLLTFSRRQEIDPRVLALNDVIRGFSKMLQRILGEHTTLKLQLLDDLNTVVGDAGQVEQVILNLALNAKDAMPGGGTFLIRTSNVLFDEKLAENHLGTAPGEYVLIEITDTGHGMSMETQERIFEPFFTTRGLQNVGLGLAVTYGIIKQHHGTISVVSEPAKGTTFHIYLPASTEVDNRKKTGMASLRGETILIVEDEKIVRDYATRVLRQFGYQVLTAESAQEAKNLINSCGSNIDLLLTDVVMPGETGVDLYHWLREKQPRIRGLFMSGYTNTIFQSYLNGVEGSELLQKPFTSQSLLQCVAKSISGGDTVSAGAEDLSSV